MPSTDGIHHVTALASDPQANRDFYEGVLGLRLVKRTVNFDDPGSHHLYYGDGVGSPGTILTFFPIAGIRRGTPGAGVVHEVAMGVPEGSLGMWSRRLTAAGAPVEAHHAEARIVTHDPDGMRLVLVETPDVRAPMPWADGPVAPDQAVQGVEGVTLLVRERAPTLDRLERWAGLVPAGDGTVRGRTALGGRVGVIGEIGAQRARMGAGTVHHVAFRTEDGEEQREWLRGLLADGADVSPVMDRDYFTSIYFREPGGVLLEVATDPPGFTRDESPEELGSALRLPAWVEAQREVVEQVLPPLGPARRLQVEAGR